MPLHMCVKNQNIAKQVVCIKDNKGLIENEVKNNTCMYIDTLKLAAT